MNIHLKYFGQISEVTGTNQETISIPSEITLEELKMLLEKKYSGLQNKTYQCAVNLKLENGNFKLSDNSEIALLPPFAGG